MQQDKKELSKISRRAVFRLIGTAATGGAFACLAVAQAQAGYGSCTACACAGFVAGNNWPQTCQRCGHSWHVHR